MIKIHHRTATKAANKGILLEEAPEGSDFSYRAFWNEKNLDPSKMGAMIEFWSNDASELCDAAIWARMMVVEYPGLSFEQEGRAISISFGSRNLGTVELLADLAQATNEALDELTDEERAEALEAIEEDEEEKSSGSVVPDKYKRLYAEAGHAGNCGDWLALTLEPLVTTKAGFDVDAMDEIARLNGVDTSALNRTSRGWQGRYRMTTRNMLVKAIAKQGFLSVPPFEGGDSIKAPSEWLAVNTPKPKEAGSKRPKAA
jgi:hypothetical protein